MCSCFKIHEVQRNVQPLHNPDASNPDTSNACVPTPQPRHSFCLCISSFPLCTVATSDRRQRLCVCRPRHRHPRRVTHSADTTHLFPCTQHYLFVFCLLQIVRKGSVGAYLVIHIVQPTSGRLELNETMERDRLFEVDATVARLSRWVWPQPPWLCRFVPSCVH